MAWTRPTELPGRQQEHFPTEWTLCDTPERPDRRQPPDRERLRRQPAAENGMEDRGTRTMSRSA